MFMGCMLGGIGLGLTIGLLDVLVLRVNAIKTQKPRQRWPRPGPGHTAAGHRRPAGGRHLPHPPPKGGPPPKLAVWVQRVLHEPQYGLAVLIGAAVGTPDASYLTALHHLISTETATTVAVPTVIVFVLINW